MLSRQDFTNALLVTSVLSLAISRPTLAAKVKCYQCTNRNQQCYDSFACEGDFCVSQFSVRNKELYFTKYCENVAADSVPVKPGCRGSAKEAQETCYCNDKHYCNSALSTHSAALVTVVSIISLTVTVVHCDWF